MRKNILKFFDYCKVKLGADPAERVLMAVYLFDFLDRLRLLGYPREWFCLLENESNEFFSKKEELTDGLTPYSEFREINQASRTFEKKTGKVYFDLWKDFRKEDFFIDAYSNLKERLKKNGISLQGVKSALDDGCGSGRYSFSLKKLGCLRVTGIDISFDSVSLAAKNSPYKDDGVNFLQSSVLELPFSDSSFDFIFSNGVLHHTKSTEQGLKEIFRVLKKGSFFWLYLYGGKGSLFWDIVDFSRSVLAGVPQAYCQLLMKEMGYPPGRIFHRNDFFYVPVNNRYYQAEVEKMVKDAGFSGLKRLVRGVSYDWDEIKYAFPYIDEYIFGEGEMRFIVYKH